MKTIRNFNNLLYLAVAGLFFAGCYTQMATLGDEESGRGSGDRESYIESDTATTRDSIGTTINNYFCDDGYRAWRYRLSFHYYCPSRHFWSAGIWFDPWYDDFYYYPWDPWYRPGLWYPTIAYPYPYWYPRWGYYPYYGAYYGYWDRHNYPLYGWNGEPGRRRTTGSTRGGDAGLRPRGVVSPAAVPVAGEAVGMRPRVKTEPAPPATTDADRTTRRRVREEVPWWERTGGSTKGTSERNKARGRTRVDGEPARNVGTQARGQKATGRDENVQSKPRERREQASPSRSGTTSRPRGEPSYRPAPRQEAPRSSPPAREGGRSRDGNSGSGRGDGERSRR